MKYNIYAMRDDIAETFGTPITDVNDETARRNFRFGIENAKDVRGFAPQDFSLYRIGSYDEATGSLIPELPTLIERGVKRVSDTV